MHLSAVLCYDPLPDKYNFYLLSEHCGLHQIEAWHIVRGQTIQYTHILSGLSLYAWDQDSGTYLYASLQLNPV